MRELKIKPVQESDGEWIAALLKECWGSTRMVVKGRVLSADKLPGFVALSGGERVGLLTYRIDGGQCEIVTLNSLLEKRGVGSALLAAVRSTAVEGGCSRLWLITTNDNTAALRFYQKRGFLLAAVHLNALEQSRKLKPEIPEVGIEGIPLRDEIELEMNL
ncbi:MAG: GNAT family N-acetyltransferase [Candidatus Eiseniibacteriota bacterium]|nr:MAG: GNAT family N-acetyltransferase [Candidatus Eisenbacteria bacterium]